MQSNLIKLSPTITLLLLSTLDSLLFLYTFQLNKRELRGRAVSWFLLGARNESDTTKQGVLSEYVLLTK